MEAIHFQAEVNSDNVIRVPEGVAIPQGTVHVTVVGMRKAESPANQGRPRTWDWLLEMAKEAEAIETDLPEDLAERHDFYIHGKPRE